MNLFVLYVDCFGQGIVNFFGDFLKNRCRNGRTVITQFFVGFVNDDDAGIFGFFGREIAYKGGDVLHLFIFLIVIDLTGTCFPGDVQVFIFDVMSSSSFLVYHIEHHLFHFVNGGLRTNGGVQNNLTKSLVRALTE